MFQKNLLLPLLPLDKAGSPKHWYVPTKLHNFTSQKIISFILGTVKKTVKLSLPQAMKAHRVVRRRGFHILSRQSAHRWR
jgi:hypothetical protein